MDSPSVTIIILSCDRPEWFRLALASAVDQSCRACIIVSDDSIADGVRDITTETAGQVTYVKGPGLGQLANLVNGFAHVTTEWTVVLHDDDLLEESCVERLLGALGTGDEPRIVVADSSIIDADGKALPQSGSAERRRRSLFRSGENRPSFEDRCAAFLVHGAVSPFLATLLPTALVQSWHPDPRVGSVLDLSLCEVLARNVEVIDYEPRDLIRYRVHGASVGSNFADLVPHLFVIDSLLGDPTFTTIWPALSRRRADAVARQARVWTATKRWRDARALLLDRRSELSFGYLVPSLMLTLPIARSLYGRRIRRSNPRLEARSG